MRFLRLFASVAIATGASVVTPPVSADPRTAKVLQLGFGFRYGVDLRSADTVNPWASGFGVDGGYTLPNAVFVGGSFEYFFGQEVGDDQVNGGSANLWQLSTEAGYDFGEYTFVHDFVEVKPGLFAFIDSDDPHSIITGKRKASLYLFRAVDFAE